MYSEKLKQFKASANPTTIAKIEGVGTEEALRKLIAKYHIHIDLAEEAFSALTLMCYGAMSTSECFNAVHSIGAVGDTDFVKFIQDVNENILKPLQDEVQKEVVKNDEKIESDYEKSLNSTSESDEQAIEDFFESIGLNPDGTHKESVEETLARIDKEVEDEIEAEIKAEMAAEAQKQALAEKQNSAQPKETNNFTHDIDLDNIPKSTASTYNLVKQSISEQEEDQVTTPQQEDLPEDINSVKNNSLDFIESRAAGNIKLKPEPKNTDENDTEKKYFKDPYHEDL